MSVQHPPVTILAVDDEPEGLFALEQLLKSAGYDVVGAASGEETLEKVASHAPDLILLDINLPGVDGYEVTKTLKADPQLRYIPIVLLTAKSTLEDITFGLQQGADGYIAKPYRKEELLARVSAALRTKQLYAELKYSQEQNESLTKQLVARANYSDIVGKSAAMQAIYNLIEKIKGSDVSVLITGESGTGKELVARAVHASSKRASAPFLALNCSAFNENLLESELFGYVRGAFSGAVRDKLGLFEAAHGGTIFLDELGEMPSGLQAKLLRVLQDGSFIPVGSVTPKKVDVRVVAATNRNLKEMIEKEKFRQDLFYRLNVMAIHLPPLRERRGDIELLAEYFVAASCSREGLKAKRFTAEAMARLMGYEWPGNIRELENEVAKAVLLSGDAAEIDPQFLSSHIAQSSKTAVETARSGNLKEALDALELEMIRAALAECQGNKSRAAEKLGVSRTNLIKKVQLFGLE